MEKFAFTLLHGFVQIFDVQMENDGKRRRKTSVNTERTKIIATNIIFMMLLANEINVFYAGAIKKSSEQKAQARREEIIEFAFEPLKAFRLTTRRRDELNSQTASEETDVVSAHPLR